jgi:hypothetical protein
VLAIIFYVLAAVILAGALVFSLTGGHRMVFSRAEPTAGTWPVWGILFNGISLAFGFSVLGAAFGYLHGIREYVRIIAERMPDDLQS